MQQNYSVLIIEDHPFVSDIYKSVFERLSSENEEYSFQIDIATDCDSALDKIKYATTGEGIDIIFLDINLPPSRTEDISSGEDLGVRISEVLPNAKIIVSTTYNDNYRINNIFNNVNPDGLIVKNDFNFDELKTAVKTVISGAPYYSKSVLQSFRSFLKNEYMLDEVDRKLLYELSVGARMKDMPKNIPMSIAGLEKRKRRLKDVFEVRGLNDKALVIKAKEKGFL